MRAIWSGIMSFGMVNIPIKLYTAIERNETKLKRLCECGSQVGYVNKCKGCGRELAYGDWDYGFEVAKNEFIQVKKEQVEQIRLPSQESIAITAVVPIHELSPLLYTGDHYLIGIAERKGKNKPARASYGLLSEVLRRKGIAGIAKLCMRGRESLIAIQPYGMELLASKIYYREQIRDIKIDIFEGVEEEVLELGFQLADKIKLFKPGEYEDGYAKALKQLIEEGEVPEVKSELKEEANDLKSLLEASL